MRNARQYILDVIDHPEKHQDHAKRFFIPSLPRYPT
jgi:hypothetical protein